MDRFGSDKPDMRFGMELTNVSDTVAGCDFMVFKGALENGGSVRGLNAKGLGDLGRKKIDGFVDYAQRLRSERSCIYSVKERWNSEIIFR